MKILWFSNKQVLNLKGKDSGSWILSMAYGLTQNEGLCLVNVTEAPVTGISVNEKGNIKEYVLPQYKLSNHGLPSSNDLISIINIVDKENPDLIHVWGVENYWGLIHARGYMSQYKWLLDMQGVLQSCYELYLGTLCFDDFISVMNPVKSIYAYSFVKLQKQRMKARVKYENEIISSFEHIGYQSEWVKSWVRYKNPRALLFRSDIAVREEYTMVPKWSYKQQKTIMVITSQQAYKRIDLSIKALSILRAWGEDLNLIIIGNVNSKFKGYSLYLQSLVKKLNLSDFVNFVGGKTVEEIIQLSKDAICTIVASSVESYSMVVAESLSMGIPVVASYAGAMPEFANKGMSPHYFPSGDYMACASAIEKIITECKSDSETAYPTVQVPTKTSNPSARQLLTYTKIINS